MAGVVGGADVLPRGRGALLVGGQRPAQHEREDLDLLELLPAELRPGRRRQQAEAAVQAPARRAQGRSEVGAERLLPAGDQRRADGVGGDVGDDAGQAAVDHPLAEGVLEVVGLALPAADRIAVAGDGHHDLPAAAELRDIGDVHPGQPAQDLEQGDHVDGGADVLHGWSILTHHPQKWSTNRTNDGVLRPGLGTLQLVSRVLLCGWTSFAEVVATVGDVLARDVAAGWLRDAGVPFDVAAAPPLRGPDDVDWEAVAPEAYDVVCFVCGPWGDRPLLRRLRGRFPHARLVAADITPLPDGGPPVDALLEREGLPDYAWHAPGPAELPPVLGVVRAPAQAEHGATLHREAGDRLLELAVAHGAPLSFDTDLLLVSEPVHRFTSAARVEALVARCDVVLTSRMHGLVLALRAGVPALALDPVAGGGKVTAQARAVGWPAVRAPAADDLDALVAWCLGPEARATAGASATRAASAADSARVALITALGRG